MKPTSKQFVDINGKVLRVGQHVVYSSAHDTSLEIGVIEKVCPKSVKIKRESDSFSSVPSYTHRALVAWRCFDNPDYNKIEVMVLDKGDNNEQR